MMIGQTISHYRIVEKLGEGGMGVVYKAEDTKLNRVVALKLLPHQVASDQQERARFLAEARAAAILNHPNICTIYDIHENGDEQFIIMEYIDGKSLNTRSEPMTWMIAVNIGIQLGRALAHAHRRNVVHRDIKTANIMMTEESEVKIMDFGLAMLHGSDIVAGGGISGTPAYMSPEQTRGEVLDHRTDLFSYGIVLYEVLSGHFPFRGDHPIAISYSIVNDDPIPLTSFVPDIPISLERIIFRCLEKDPAKRFQSAEEVVTELRRIRQESLGTQTVTTARKNISLKQITFADTVEEYPSWSPDGIHIVFSREIQGYKKLIIKNLADGKETQCTKGSVDDIQPSWSADGKKILFVRSRQVNGKLEPGDIFSYYVGGDVWTLDIDTFKEHKIIENAYNPSFSPDGVWIAVDASWAGPRRIWLVDARGRNPRQITSDISEAVAHVAPKWSPDGTRIVFQNVERVKFDIRVVDINSGRVDWITDDSTQNIYPAWSRSGTEIFLSSFRSGGLNIWSIPSSHSIGGGAEQLTVGAGQDVQVAVSPDGDRLLYATMRLNADLWRIPVSPSTGMPTGSPEPLVTGTREESRGAWSPDGTMIAFNSDRSGDMNIWIYSLSDGSIRQLTEGAGGDFQPNWSPDGKWITFFSARSGRPDIWIVSAAAGELTQLTTGSSLKINPFFSPDGSCIAYHSDAAGRLEPWVMKANGADQRKITEMEVSGHFMRWTKDGISIIFRSPNPLRPGLWRSTLGNEEPVFVCSPKGGAHISLSPDSRLIMDVVDHKELWITPMNGDTPQFVFKFEDPQVRIDYPVWSPDGNWLLFDRVKPQGGNIWLMEHRV